MAVVDVSSGDAVAAVMRSMFGQDWKPSVPYGTCECGGELLEHFDGVRDLKCHPCAEREEKETNRRKHLLEYLLETTPRLFHDARFDSPELRSRVHSPSAIAQARAAVDAPWVVLIGPAGAGKTTLACAIGRERAATTRVRFTDCFKLAVARAQHGLGDGEAPAVEEALTAGVLILDDVGAERATPTSAVAEVIHERHAEERVMIVTTGFPIETLEAKYGSGIGRRIFERATIIDCGGAK